MAINPVPSVIDLASAEHAKILTDYYSDTTGVVYEPVEVDTNTCQADKIQAYLNLLEDRKPKDTISVLQFPVGGIISIKKTLQINRCVGPELRGGGYKFSEEAYLSATTTITAMDYYREDADGNAVGFIDPFNPGNKKPPMFRTRYVVGLSLRGIAFDGKNSTNFTGDGFQMISSGGTGVNAAKHRYEMMAIRNCARGWSHDRYAPGAGPNGGDAFNFSQCMFEKCLTAVYIDSFMDLQTSFTILGVNHCRIAFEFYQCGQVRISTITLVNTLLMIQSSRMESNNRHIYLQGLKCDAFYQRWRPTLYKEIDVDTQPDGSKIPSRRVGGTRGNVTLSDMMMAETLGRVCLGDVLSVTDHEGKARFRIKGVDPNANPTFAVGRWLTMTDNTNDAYNLDTTIDKGQSWVVHEITAYTAVSGSSPTEWDIDTDTDYAGPGEGTWVDGTPLIIQTGGSAVTIKESFIPATYHDHGRLAWMTTGNYGPSSISAILFVVRAELGRFGDIGPARFIREMVAPNTNTGGEPWNYWKFTDCWGVWDKALPPWSDANY